MTDSEYEDLGRFGDLVRGNDLAPCSSLDFRAPLERLWDAGMPAGERTGWPSVDRHYTVAPGQLTVVTGWPGSGKSEWLDALLLNLAKRGWRFALFSPENQPSEIHVAKLLEKFTGKPFGDGPTERMSKDEAMECAVEISDWFAFLSPANGTERTSFGVEDILGCAEQHFRALGMWGARERKGLVIDPYNELEHLRARDQSETEYISALLSRIRGWARMHHVHVWLVAHPQKMRREDGKLPIPRPDMISGSQHWWNKTDNAITVYRDFEKPDSQVVEIHVQKVRFKHIGRPGLVELLYDRISGQYREQLKGLSWEVGR